MLMYCRLLCLSCWLTPSLILQADNKLTSIRFVCSVSWWVCLLWTRTAASLSAGWERAFIIHLFWFLMLRWRIPVSSACDIQIWAAKRRVCSTVKTHMRTHKENVRKQKEVSRVIKIPYKSTHCTHIHTRTHMQWSISVPLSYSDGHQCLITVLAEWWGQHVLLATHRPPARQPVLIQIFSLLTRQN